MILQIAATGTWTAYNTWGGSNHYQGITGPKRNQYATTVSLERPWCRGFVVLPEEAPRVPLEILTAAGDGAALSASGVGVRERLFQQVRFGRLGELRPAFLSLGGARGIRRRSREPTRIAFRPGDSRRLRLRGLRGT